MCQINFSFLFKGSLSFFFLQPSESFFVRNSLRTFYFHHSTTTKYTFLLLIISLALPLYFTSLPVKCIFLWYFYHLYHTLHYLLNIIHPRSCSIVSFSISPITSVFNRLLCRKMYPVSPFAKLRFLNDIKAPTMHICPFSFSECS
jgi:hypothetical protein